LQMPSFSGDAVPARSATRRAVGPCDRVDARAIRLSVIAKTSPVFSRSRRGDGRLRLRPNCLRPISAPRQADQSCRRWPPRTVSGR
jgi:hypothetical protein